jgi:hypothetical protein
MAFEQQEPLANLGFSRQAPQPQQVGVRLKPKDKKTETPGSQRPPQRRGF